MAAPKAAPSVRVVDTLVELKQLVAAYVKRGTPVYADTETTGLDPRKNKLVAVQLNQQGGYPVVIDWRRFDDADLTWEASALLQRMFDNCMAVFHNANFDWQFLYANDIEVKKVWDTQLAEQVIHGLGIGDGNAKAGVEFNLAALVKRYCDVELDKTQRTWFYSPAPLDERPEWHEPFPDDELEYMRLDVEYLPAICTAQAKLLREKGLMKAAVLEMDAVPAVAAMSYVGLRINPQGWLEEIERLDAKQREMLEEVVATFGPPILKWRTERFDAALKVHQEWEQRRDDYLGAVRLSWEQHQGEPGFGMWGEFKNSRMKQWREAHPNPGKPKPDTSPPNLSSPTQFLVALNALGIPAKTTQEDELTRLSEKYPALQGYVRWKKVHNIVTKYGPAYVEKHVNADGRVFAEWNQIGADTGRMSCSKPNLQQISSKGDGKVLRKHVIPADGYKLCVADFKNIELYILANLSEDEAMLGMFRRGEDMHSFTARQMFGIPDDVDPKEVEIKPGITARDVAKTINFGVAYGQSKYGFSLKFGVSEDEAQEFIDKYYRLYAGARHWLDRAGELAVERGYSETMAGRKRFYNLEEPPRPATSDALRLYRARLGAIRRAGMNHPIQGTSADISKLAVTLFYRRCPSQWGRLVAVVHDELVVESLEDRTEEVSNFMADAMYEACCTFLKTLPSPRPSVHVGNCWEK